MKLAIKIMNFIVIEIKFEGRYQLFIIDVTQWTFLAILHIYLRYFKLKYTLIDDLISLKHLLLSLTCLILLVYAEPKNLSFVFRD